MDIRSPEARSLSQALAMGRIKLQKDGLYIPASCQLFGKTDQDRFVRYDEVNAQWNVLSQDRTRFVPVRALHSGENLRCDWPLNAEQLLPKLSYWERIKEAVVPTIVRAAGFVVVGSFFGTLLRSLPALCGAILGRLPNPVHLMQGHHEMATRASRIVAGMAVPGVANRALQQSQAAAASHTPAPAHKMPSASQMAINGYMPPPDDMMDRVNADLANLDRMASRHGAASTATCEEQGLACPPDTRPLFGHGLSQDVMTGVGLGAMAEIGTTALTGEGIISRVATAARPTFSNHDQTKKEVA